MTVIENEGVRERSCDYHGQGMRDAQGIGKAKNTIKLFL